MRARTVTGLAVAALAGTALAAASLGAAPAGAAVVSTRGQAVSRLATAAPPRLDVRGGELVNLGTGALLWRKDRNVRRPMASITKVMTAILVLRAGGLQRRIKITPGAVRYVRRNGASSAGLVAGDVLTARELLKAMLIPSGCDAAYMLATSYGPGRQRFVRKMNSAAKAMGLASTHFTSFDGLPIPTGHSTYSTPRDLVRLGEKAMGNALFRSIVAKRRASEPATAQHHRYLWRTTNLLLGSYRGAIGIKTGNTGAAGNCLLFEARRGKHTLIGVILHANPASDWQALLAATRRLLNWGFRRV